MRDLTHVRTPRFKIWAAYASKPCAHPKRMRVLHFPNNCWTRRCYNRRAFDQANTHELNCYYIQHYFSTW